MIKFLLFLKRIHYGLLFLVLEAVAISVFCSGNAYQRSRILNASNMVLGGVNSKISGLGDYFALRSQNEEILEQMAGLQGELFYYRELSGALGERLAGGSSAQHYAEVGGSDFGFGHSLDSSGVFSGGAYVRGDSVRVNRAKFMFSRVVSNSITRRDNFLVINKGRRDGVQADMALVSGAGIVGYVLSSSDNYSVALSVLNVSDFRTSGKIKGTDFTGSISWDGLSHQVVDFTEVPKYSGIEAGDTIVTTDYSNIFPADLPIGVVESFELRNGTFYDARVRLFADMSSLNYLYVVQRRDYAERDSLMRAVVVGDER